MISNEQYLRTGAVACPFCNSIHLTFPGNGNVEFEGATKGIVRIQCKDCERKYSQLWEMFGYIEEG